MGYSREIESSKVLLTAALCFLGVFGTFLIGTRSGSLRCSRHPGRLWSPQVDTGAFGSWERAAHAARPNFAGLQVNPKQNASIVATNPGSLMQNESTSVALNSALEPVVAALIDKGTPSDISAQLPGESSIADSCTVLQQQANEADACVRLDSRESLLIILCSQHGNTESTLLIYSLNPAGLEPGQTYPSGLHNIYRVRVLGHEVLQPAVNYCGNVAAAAFKVAYPGRYHLEVLQLYHGFSYAAPTYGIADIHAAYYTFNTTMIEVAGTPAAARPCHLQPYTASEAAVQAGGLQVSNSSINPATEAASPVSTSADNNSRLSSIASSNDSCPVCKGPNHKGRWVVAPGANTTLLANVQQALQRTCAFNSSLSYDNFFGCPMGMLPAVVPEAEDHPVLEWAPYSCRCVLRQYIVPGVQAACNHNGTAGVLLMQVIAESALSDVFKPV